DGNNQFDTNLSGETDEQNLAGKVGVQWDFRDNAMVYATYSQGYKGPAFNVFYNMDDDDINPIDAEESDSFELGTKWTFDQGYFALTYFNTEIENFQANDFDASDGTTITGFTNGGDVETQGWELDFIYQPTDNLSFSGGVAVIDAESTTGAALPFSPDLRYSLVSRYDLPLESGAKVRFNGNYVYSDEKLSGNIGQIDEVPFLLPDYGLLNASVAYISKDEKLNVALIGKNLTDESFATTFAGDGFRYTVPRDADRYFGINIRLSY
ncbi:MAG: TonB-dependent receptor, partial [Pseudomonadota bacterium]